MKTDPSAKNMYGLMMWDIPKYHENLFDRYIFTPTTKARKIINARTGIRFLIAK